MTRFGKFAGVGLIGWGVQLAALSALLATGAHYLVATALAVELTILHNFVWHELFTWREAPSTSVSAVAARLMRFTASTAVVSIPGNVILTASAVELLDLHVTAANALAVCVLATLNYHVASRWVFGAGSASRTRPLNAAAFTLAPVIPCRRPPRDRALEAHGAHACCVHRSSRLPRAVRVLATRLPRPLA